MRGNLVKTQKEPNASLNVITTIDSDFVRGQQMYIIKVITDRDTFVKTVVSGK